MRHLRHSCRTSSFLARWSPPGPCPVLRVKVSENKWTSTFCHAATSCNGVGNFPDHEHQTLDVSRAADVGGWSSAAFRRRERFSSSPRLLVSSSTRLLVSSSPLLVSSSPLLVSSPLLFSPLLSSSPPLLLFSSCPLSSSSFLLSSSSTPFPPPPRPAQLPAFHTTRPPLATILTILTILTRPAVCKHGRAWRVLTGPGRSRSCHTTRPRSRIAWRPSCCPR
jgi:hypothetical protein